MAASVGRRFLSALGARAGARALTGRGNTRWTSAWRGREWLPVALLTAAGLLLRIIRLDFQPLWFDEGYSFYFAGNSVGELVAGTAVDIHPPLYYLLLKGWLALAGVGVVQARVLSVLAGAAAIPLLYLLGRRLGSRRLGLLAAGVLALSPFHVYYSQEVRMYGLVTSLGLLAGLLALRAFEEGDGPGPWIAAGAALVAALHTQYYAAFIPIGLTIYLLLRPDLRRRRAIPWLLTLAGVGLACLPWAIYAAPRLIVYVQYKVGMDKDLPLSLLEFLRRVLVAWGAGHMEGWLARWWLLGLLPPALWTAGHLLRAAARRRPGGATGQPFHSRPGLFALSGMLAPLAGAYLINLAAPFNPPRSERLLLLALPAFCLFAGLALEQLLRLPWRWGRTVALCSGAAYLAVAGLTLAAFYTAPRYAGDDYRPVAAEIAARGLPEDAVICVLPWQVGYFRAYLDEPRPALVETPAQIYPRARQFWADDPARMAAELDQLMDRHERLWLPAYMASGSRLEPLMADYLDSRYARALSHWHGATLLSLHVPAPALQPASAAGDFAGLLTVDQVALPAGPVASAYGAIVVQSRWEKAGPIESEYHFVLRLSDERERTWAQWDRQPLNGRRPLNMWEEGESHQELLALLIDAGTPPGRYALRLSVRGPDGAPLHLLDAGDSGPADELILGEVEVVRPEAPVRPAALPAEKMPPVQFEESLRLLTYRLDERPFTPGENLVLDLYWQCLRPLEDELVTFVQLLDDDEQLAAAAEVPPTAGFFPVPLWQPGDVVRDPQSLRLPASLPEGEYRLIVGLFRASTRERLRVTAGGRGRGDYVELAQIVVAGRPHNFEPPQPAQAIQARFGDVARLIGYDLEWRPAEGEAAGSVTLHWQALSETPISYKVFVHLYDAAGRRVGQHDSEPGLGSLPTTGWLTGEFIADPHPLRPEFGAPGDVAEIWVGLYDPATGRRLPLLDDDGNSLGDHFTIALPR